jgi:hypothetical protein
MSIIRIYVRPVAITNWPGVESLPLIEFDPVNDDNAGQLVRLGDLETIPGKCYPSDIEVPDGFALVETFPGCKHVEAPDGKPWSASDIVGALIHGQPGFRLVDGGAA